MAIRKDGVKSKERLLVAASEVFAQKGYRDAAVAEICKRAGSNVAAVNYHFGSKDELYATVWRSAFEEAMQVYPPDGGLPPDAPAEKRLGALIHSSLHRILDDGKLGRSGQILLHEMAEPTDVIDKVLDDSIRSVRERTEQIIRELLGPKASEQELRFCELSVVHQCFAIGFAKGRKKLPPFAKSDKPLSKFIDELAEHITVFSLAGIAAIRDKAEQGPAVKQGY
jgi:AcrR family transcriptional regulator